MWHDSVERTLRIGFGIKRATCFEIESPKFHRFAHPLDWRESIPFLPLVRLALSLLQVGASLLIVHGSTGFHVGSRGCSSRKTRWIRWSARLTPRSARPR